jgi:hypothetical protein
LDVEDATTNRAEELMVQLLTLRKGLKKFLPAFKEENYSPVRYQLEAKD